MYSFFVDMGFSRKLFVLGTDAHGSKDYHASSDVERFPDSVSFSEVPQKLPNDIANTVIAKAIFAHDLDILFVNDHELVKKYIRDKACKALLFHCEVKDYGDTTRLLLARPDILRIIMLSPGSMGINFSDQQMFREITTEATPTSHIYRPLTGAEEYHLIMAVKPFSVTVLSQILSGELMDSL